LKLTEIKKEMPLKYNDMKEFREINDQLKECSNTKEKISQKLKQKQANFVYIIVFTTHTHMIIITARK